ncbi:MAG: hypothetical protein ABFD79_14750 [Phycisphaerales bacterium]
MADNTQLPIPQTAGDLIATDEIAGVKYQRIKMIIGADGVNDGDISAANPLPITNGSTPLEIAGAIADGGDATTAPMLLVGGKTGAGFAQVFETNGSGHLNISDGGGSITVDNTHLTSIDNKLPAIQTAMPNGTDQFIPIRQLPQRVVATSYAAAGAGVNASEEVLIQTGAGMAVNRTGGNLVITSGTTVNSETVIRSVESVDGRVTFSVGDTLSQRIVNNNFYREFVDVIGDGLAYNIVNTTTVDVTKVGHGFTSANIGQRMDICAMSSVGVPQEAVIASIPNADTIRFTVAGFPASGSGTCSLTGWNKIELLFTGTSATTVNINSRRRGYQNTSTAMTISTTASGSLIMCTLQNDRITFSTGTLAVGSVLTDRSVIFTNIPEPDTQFYYQIRVKNGTVAPASTTTWTCAFTRMQDFIATQVELTGLRQFGLGATLPVSGAVTSTGTTTATLAASAVRAGFIASSGIWFDDSATTLAANATFTGTSRDLTVTATATAFANAATYAKELRVSAESDVSGTLWLEVSRDNTTWRRVKSVATAAVTGGGQYAEIVHLPSWRYARVGFTNGATIQARFTINSVLTAA